MKSVVIIDDDQGVIEALQAALELWDFQTTGVSDTKMVLSTLKKIKPDIIFLDLLLSGVDGVEITKQIRAQKKFEKTPIVLMSAHPTAKEISKTISVNGFLPKPFTLDRLRSLVHSLL